MFLQCSIHFVLLFCLRICNFASIVFVFFVHSKLVWYADARYCQWQWKLAYAISSPNVFVYCLRMEFVNIILYFTLYKWHVFNIGSNFRRFVQVNACEWPSDAGYDVKISKNGTLHTILREIDCNLFYWPKGFKDTPSGSSYPWFHVYFGIKKKEELKKENAICTTNSPIRKGSTMYNTGCIRWILLSMFSANTTAY